jgi:hypothetical protein
MQTAEVGLPTQGGFRGRAPRRKESFWIKTRRLKPRVQREEGERRERALEAEPRADARLSELGPGPALEHLESNKNSSFSFPRWP